MSSNAKATHYAYGPQMAEIESIMRFGSVKRWHMIDTTRQQTLAEHSACVAALAYGIASKTTFFGPPERVGMRALFHDLAEVFTGDIPSHTKKYLSGIKEFEAEVLPVVWNMSGGEHIDLLIKACDIADGIRFIRLHGVDITGVHARDGLEAQFKARCGDMTTANWPDEVCDVARSWLYFYAYEKS